ncbi:MAG: hypothetical protein B5M54_03105 [Candidatus Aminicenantes bacterium 4484_214]|nr:MAG: hypothetical protein B5M54_03105 [Candidatus Aminicenantes bacterium 4484_214]RLE07637.1 MAG: hypothetical protein DRJ06_05625 [Candidatus Aminicenantes bacterium]
MKLSRKKLIFFLLQFGLWGCTLALLCWGELCCLNQEKFSSPATNFTHLSSPSIRIAITDSGLGGLSIAAHLVKRMKMAKAYREGEIIFYNALFSSQGGYNTLSRREDKIKIFHSALTSLERRYNPDLIIIGCNTLSVLFPETPFARQSKIPVWTIVKPGLEMLTTALRQHPEALVIIYGTPTTIKEGTYQEKLIRQGFLPERIVAQACPELEVYIERWFDQEETQWLIQGYIDESWQQIPNPQAPIIASLNCTHYAYVLPFWEKALSNSTHKLVALLNPNLKLIDPLFPEQLNHRFSKCSIKVKVVSMVPIPPETIDSIGRALNPISPATATALQQYELIPDLFEWQKYLHLPQNLDQEN